MKKIIVVFGTRPEAIKMAPIVKELKKNNSFKTIVCVTAQHRQMLDSVLKIFDIIPDYDLNLMSEKQTLAGLTSIIITKMKEVYDKEKPDLVLVHGDTTTAMASALSAFYEKIKIGHVEAGLRTFNKHNPFPEEINRVIIGNIADFHFAPTKQAAKNLKKANAKNVYVTGNTVIDALLETADKYNLDLKKYNLDTNLRTILITIHRRENHGDNILNVCRAIKNLIEKNSDIQFVIPVHLNPNVKDVIFTQLGNIERAHLIEPLDYAEFVGMMKKSYLILTDSGGIQEEAPSLKKPTLVLREETERPEAVKSGAVKLVGTNTQKIIKEVQNLLDDKQYYLSMSDDIKNPYGNGKAAKKIIGIIQKELA